MKSKVQWVNKPKDCGKYILLCNVVSRIPEDVKRVIQDLGLEGEALVNNTMVVAMHRSETGQHETVSNFIETPDESLNKLKLANLFYCGNTTLNIPANRKETTDIELFLFE